MDDINEISTEYGFIADKIDNLRWSPHSNKKVLYFRAINDGSNNYRYRLGIQMSHASPIANTVAIEQLFTTQGEWNKAQITINGSGIAVESYHTTKFRYTVGNTMYYYTKTIVQLKKLTAVSHYLYYTTHIDNVTLAPNHLQLYAIVYGVDSFLSDVDSGVYNLTPFILTSGGKMRMQTDIDMSSAHIYIGYICTHRIENLGDPVSVGDAVNKSYSDSLYYYAAYRKIFPVFYDLLETTHYNLIQTSTGKQIDKINPDLILGTNRTIGDYALGFGLRLSTGTYLRTTDTFDQNSSFTLFISFQHDSTKTCQLNWVVGNSRTHPRYKITSNQITIDGSSRGTYTVQFPSRYQNKKIFLWVCFDGSNNTYKMRLGDYATIATFSAQPPVNFTSNRLELDFDVNVNK